MQLTGTKNYRTEGPFTFVGGESCSPSLPKDPRWSQAFPAIQPLLEELPSKVMMIDIKNQGDTIHHTVTKEKLEAEWMPQLNQILQKYGLIAHLVTYWPTCLMTSEYEVVTGGTRLMFYSLGDQRGEMQRKMHDNISLQHKLTVSDKKFSATHYAPFPQKMER